MDKNRKRKAKDEDREAALLETRAVMELLKAVVGAYRSVFPLTRRLANVDDAEKAVRRFLSLILPYESVVSEADKEKLIRCGLKPFLVNSNGSPKKPGVSILWT